MSTIEIVRPDEKPLHDILRGLVSKQQYDLWFSSIEVLAARPDGVQLAYAKSGHGPAVVKAGHWMTHLERDWTSQVWRHWVAFLSEEHTLVR